MSATQAAEKRARWQRIVSEWEQSGLSQAAFCREQGLSIPLFYYWRRRVKELAVGSSGQQTAFVEVPCTEASAGADGTGSGRGRSTGTVADSNPAASGVRLHLGSGMLVEVERGFDAATLKTVLTVVGDRC